MSELTDTEQESKFQEIFYKVNQIETYDKHLTERDLRIMFVAGMDFQKSKIVKDFFKEWTE